MMIKRDQNARITKRTIEHFRIKIKIEYWMALQLDEQYV